MTTDAASLIGGIVVDQPRGVAIAVAFQCAGELGSSWTGTVDEDWFLVASQACPGNQDPFGGKADSADQDFKRIK